jgi:Flp pilus assembly protein TadD
LGRGPEALAGWDRLLEVNPKHPEAWSEKGIMLLKLQRFDEALVCLDRALGVNRRSSHAWFGKGMVLAIKGDFIQALTCFEEAALLGHSQAGQHAALCRQQLNYPRQLSRARYVHLNPVRLGGLGLGKAEQGRAKVIGCADPGAEL